jgi:hypothetical protein
MSQQKQKKPLIYMKKKTMALPLPKSGILAATIDKLGVPLPSYKD